MEDTARAIGSRPACGWIAAVTGEYKAITSSSGRASTGFNQTSDGTPVLARPYTDATHRAARPELIAYPGQVVGGVCVTDSTTVPIGGHQPASQPLLLARAAVVPRIKAVDAAFRDMLSRLDFITGFRYYNLGDNLGITENLTNRSVTTNSVPVGTMITSERQFPHAEQFLWRHARADLDVTIRIAGSIEGTRPSGAGSQQPAVTINGSTTTSFPGQPTVVNPGGLFALSSNIGSYSHTNFMAIPQISGRLGYRLTPRLTAFVGYTFIYWGQVVRAGDQVNTTVNPNLIPPATTGRPCSALLYAPRSKFLGTRHHARRTVQFLISSDETATDGSCHASPQSNEKRLTP